MRAKASPLRVVSLGVSMFAFWLLLSGHYTPWLVGAGAAVAVLVALIGARVGYADAEGHPIEWAGRMLRYGPWLLLQIAKSSWSVTRVILDPRLPIAPRFMTVPASQKTATGIGIYANSITLTPGTITVEVHRRPGELLVHALTEESAADLASGDMDRRVTSVEAA